MRDTQKGHHGNAAPSRVTWFKAKQTSSAPIYIEFHLTTNLFSVLFIITGLDYVRSNLENMVDNLHVVGPYERLDNLQHLQPEKPNWGLTKARCKHLISKSHIPHFSTLDRSPS